LSFTVHTNASTRNIKDNNFHPIKLEDSDSYIKNYSLIQGLA